MSRRTATGHRTFRADLTVAGTLTFAGNHGGNRTMRGYDLHYAGTPRPCTLGPVGRI